MELVNLRQVTPTLEGREKGEARAVSEAKLEPISDTEMFRVEQIEDSLDRLVEQRAQNHKAVEERARMYRESIQRYHWRRDDARRREWLEHEKKMAEIHAALAEEHLERAEALQSGAGRV